VPPNRFESEVGNFLEGSHGDRTHIKRAGHHTVTPLCGTLLPMRGARICYPRVPRLMREDHRRISPRCVTNRNSSCTISLDHTRHITLPAARLDGPPGTKLSQQAALAGPPGTKLSQRAPKCRFRAIFRMQGELFTASATNTTSREKKVTHQHSTAPQQRAALQISHAIRLRELSTKPRNVAIPTITIQISKHSQGNCLRN